MIEVLYKVVFDGDLLPGYGKAEVQEKLAALFSVDAKAADKLFSGKQYKVKSKLDLKQAKKYALALAKLGALGYIEQEVVERIEPSEQEAFERTQRNEQEAFERTQPNEQEAFERTQPNEQEQLESTNAYNQVAFYSTQPNEQQDELEHTQPVEQVELENTQPVEHLVVEEPDPFTSPNGEFTETGSFDMAALSAHFEALEAKKAENNKVTDFEILSLDELDDVTEELQKDDAEPSGVQNVLSAEQIAKMLNQR